MGQGQKCFEAWYVTAGLAESSGSLLLGLSPVSCFPGKLDISTRAPCGP